LATGSKESSKPPRPVKQESKPADTHGRSASLPLESSPTEKLPCKPLAHTLPQPFKDFAVVTDVGISRETNEDKVCIIQRFSREDDQSSCNPCGFFSLYDGHGGSGCANYLRDNLYTQLASNQFFKTNKMRALQESVIRIEEKFEAKSIKDSDFSGSCALVALVEFDRLTLANVGDSRLICHSREEGTKVLTTDHKPESTKERERILRAGGKVYRTKTETTFDTIDHEGKLHQIRKEICQGPFRVEPGGLSVSRAIGDVKVKQFNFGGKPGCVIAEPEIREVSLTDQTEFLVLACDGIFDVLENAEVTKIVRESLKISSIRKYEARAACKQACIEVVEAAKERKSKDNLTVVLVTMKDITYFATI
jgi:protein phosphatase PTC2/3